MITISPSPLTSELLDASDEVASDDVAGAEDVAASEVVASAEVASDDVAAAEVAAGEVVAAAEVAPELSLLLPQAAARARTAAVPAPNSSRPH